MNELIKLFINYIEKKNNRLIKIKYDINTIDNKITLNIEYKGEEWKAITNQELNEINLVTAMMKIDEVLEEIKRKERKKDE